MFCTKILCSISLVILLINYTKPCANVPKLITPGLGWDALVNKDRQQIFKWTYDKCKLSSDGRFLIPDNTEAVKINQDIEIIVQLFEHWTNYTVPNAAGLKISNRIWPKEFLPLYYSFSEDYQEMKSLQFVNRTFTARSELRQLLYRVKVTSDVEISDNLYKRFVKIMSIVDTESTLLAKNLVEFIVRDYGTHYSKSIDVGAIFIKEDYLRSSFLKAYKSQKENIISASKLALLDLTGFPVSNKTLFDSSLVSEYKIALITKRIKFFGGVNWDNGIHAQNIVAINKSGDLLTGLITAERFQNVSLSSLIKTRQLLDETIQEYYRRNIHPGCTNSRSNNFDYIANVDDGSCSPVYPEIIFGGVYQTCEYRDYQNTEIVCSEKTIYNLLTGDFNCMSGFNSTPIHSDFMGTSWSYTSINMTTFICLSNSSVVGSSYLFGGLYSADVNNTHTKAQSCPKSYKALSIIQSSLNICVNTTNDESAKRYELDFGGFAGVYNEFTCNVGYEKHLAIKLLCYQMAYYKSGSAQA